MSMRSALRGALQVYRAERAETALLTAYRKAVEAHLRAGERFEVDHTVWSRRRVLLSTIADETQAYHGVALHLSEHLEARPGERLYAHVAEGGLVEQRDGEVPMVIGGGEIWVTSARVILAGAVGREWEFGDQAPIHHGPAMTLLPALDRLRASGISYPGPAQDAFRRRLELAHASVAGTRHELVRAAQRELKEHLAEEPTGPGPAPVAPVLHFVGEHS